MDKAVLTKKIIRNLARVNALKDGFKRDSEKRPSQTLCKPPERCRIEASHRR